MTARALPVCVIGDSFVAGFGDRTGRGWTEPLREAAEREGLRLELAVAGVPGDTSEMILDRWAVTETLPGVAVIAEFGVNDVLIPDPAVDSGDSYPPGHSPRERVSERGTLAALRTMIDRTPAGRLLVVGPPPIAWREINARTRARAHAIAAVCTEVGVPFVPTFDALDAEGTWMQEVMAGDGAHPGPAGYEEFARVVSPSIIGWLNRVVDAG